MLFPQVVHAHMLCLVLVGGVGPGLFLLALKQLSEREGLLFVLETIGHSCVQIKLPLELTDTHTHTHIWPLQHLQLCMQTSASYLMADMAEPGNPWEPYFK